MLGSDRLVSPLSSRVAPNRYGSEEGDEPSTRVQFRLISPAELAISANSTRPPCHKPLITSLCDRDRPIARRQQAARWICSSGLRIKSCNCSWPSSSGTRRSCSWKLLKTWRQQQKRGSDHLKVQHGVSSLREQPIIRTLRTNSRFVRPRHTANGTHPFAKAPPPRWHGSRQRESGSTKWVQR